MNTPDTQITASTNSPLLTVDEATQYLKLSVAKLARMRKEKEGPRFVKMGTRVLYRQIDLDSYIASQLV